MKFILWNVFKTLKRGKRINAVIVFTLFIAYLFFFIGCSYIEDGLQDMKSFRQTKMENAIYFESMADFSDGIKQISEVNFGEFFRKYDFVESFTAVEKNYLNDPLAGEAFSYCLLSQNYADFFFVDVLYGRYFTPEEMKEGMNVCIVEKAFRDTKNVDVGDDVTIGGTKLEVVGVIKRNADAGKVFIPERTMKSDTTRGQHFQGYAVCARLNDETRRFDIQWERMGLVGRLYTAQEYYHRGVQFFFSRSILVFIICAVLLFYALLNLVNIMIGKLETEKKSLGIRLALGASYRQIFVQFFFECLILILIAVGIIFLLEPAINDFVSTRFNHYLGVFSVFAMLCASVFSSFLISRILMSKLKKMNVIEVIKDR